MTPALWAAAVLVVAAAAAWPASALLDRRAEARRARARARVAGYLEHRLTAADTQVLTLADLEAAQRQAQGDALGRALDATELYGRHAPTAQLPASVEARHGGAVWHYPPAPPTGNGSHAAGPTTPARQ